MTSAFSLLALLDAAGPVLTEFVEVEDRLVADLGLSSARLRVLSAMAQEEQPRTVSRLARRLGITRQGVQRLVNDLEARGLVAWLRNPDHARAQLVCMTEDGRGAYVEAQRRRLALAEALAQGLEPSWVEVASGLLTLIRKRLRLIQN
jgi:DNA-binding MarR family transcriptional regulator